MDPQQRQLLEVTWEGLERAGLVPGGLTGTDTGVFVGAWSDDYGRRLLEDVATIEAWTGVGASLGSAAARLSYHLGLHGPSVTVDTACSSSLVAVHQACQSLRAGETQLAIAAGVNLLLSPGLTVNFDRAGALSRSGRCRAFDADADGYVRAEGCAVVVLKKLSDALADGDRVLGVLRGSAVTQNGHGAGIMAPSSRAQARTIRKACAAAGVGPETLDYIEAHGTGTPAGDAAEAAGIAEAVGALRPGHDPCLVGSVKTNVGHAESAAGVIGLIKVLLALRHGRIPPSLHYRRPNPALAAGDLGFQVVTELVPWPRRDRPHRAGVSSYGFGGTNAHVVVEEAPEGPVTAGEVSNSPSVAKSAATAPTENRGRPWVFPWSAASSAARALAGERLADWLRDTNEPVDHEAIAHTLAGRRSHSVHRAAAVAESPEELLRLLHSWTVGDADANLVGGRVLPGAAAGVVWVFSGHGSQWTGMARELLATEPVFSVVVDELEPVFAEEAGFSLREFITDGDATKAGADQVQPVIFAVQTALAEMWRAHGVQPAAVIGHSVGEIAAAVACGGLSRTDAARLVCRRSALLRRVLGMGAMALVALPADEVRQLLRRQDDLALSVAISASPESTVIAGTPDDIESAIKRWSHEDILVRRVASDVAFHSPQMDPLLDELAAAAHRLDHQLPALPMYSTSGGEPRGSHVLDASYWVRNLRGEVRLDAAVRAAAEDGYRVFVEISPHPVVVHSVRETLNDAGVDDAYVTGTLRRATPERRAFLRAAAALHCYGVPVHLDAGYDGGPWVDLPTTTWDHQRHWRESRTGARTAPGHAPGTGTLLGTPAPFGAHGAGRLWHTVLDSASVPGSLDAPGGRSVVGVPVLLATLTAASRAAAVGASDDDPVTVRGVELWDTLSADVDRSVQVALVEGELTITSTSAVADGPHLVHATGRLARTGESSLTAHGPAETRLGDALDGPPAGAPSGEPTRPWRVLAHRLDEDELTMRVEIVQSRVAGQGTGKVWATWIDAVLTLAPCLLPADYGHTTIEAIEELSATASPPGQALIRLTRNRPALDTGAAPLTAGAGPTLEATVLGPEGELLRLGGLSFTAYDDSRDPADFGADVLTVEWERLPLPPGPPTPPGPVVVIGSADGPARSVEAGLRAEGARTLLLERSDRLADPELRTALTEACALVLVPSRAPADEEAVTGSRMVERVAAVTWETVRAIRELAHRPERAVPRLWCAVGDWDGRGAESLEDHALRGLSRVASGEYPGLWGGTVHRDSLVPHDRAFGDLLRVLCEAPREEVLRLTGDGPLRPRLAPAPLSESVGTRCAPDGTYLITGGLGALGLRFAGELVAMGARRIVLAGRRALPPRTAWPEVTDAATRYRIDRVRRMEEAGVAVRTVAVDVADEEQVRTLLDPDALGMPPVRGVVHAAGVISGAMLQGMAHGSLLDELRPKVGGAMTLDRLYPPGTVDFFVLFSAVAAQLGLAGQGGYATANAFLDALAERRRADGCEHALSIAWPAWRDTGLAATAGALETEFEAVGVRDLTAREGLAAWRYAARCAPAHLVVLPVDRARRPARPLPLLERLFARPPAGGEGSGDTSRTAYRDLGGDELRARVLDTVTTMVATELGLAAAALERRRPLAEIGMDSIMALAIRRGLEREFDLMLPATLLWNFPTVQALGERVAGLLSPPAEASPDDVVLPAPASSDDPSPAAGGLAALLDEFEAEALPDGTGRSAQVTKGQA